MNNVNANDVKIEAGWKKALSEEFAKPYFSELKSFLVEERGKYIIYPPGPSIFAAFNRTPFDKVKVVIMGQDPYHGPGQANGLCFSVAPGCKLPPSLKNIYKEITADLSQPMGNNGDLGYWADQGVLLLNATLSVRNSAPASHQGKGWEQFTDSVIRLISEKKKGIVFLLWGRPAQMKEKLIDTERHYVLKAAHPSPLSAYNGFFGCRHFSYCNKMLVDMGKTPVNWNIP
ncbi:MAG: uracil-DNA glycosylase [Bacteroidia bacterium]